MIALCGDIYQSSMPSGASLHAMTVFLEKLMALDIPVFMLSGNHDSDARISYLSPLLQKAKVYTTAAFQGTLQKRTILTKDGEADVYMLPFIKPVQIREWYPEEEITTYEDAVQTVIRHADIDPQRRSILLCHQCVTGSEEAGSEERIIGGSEDVGVKVFDGFRLVLLGHIHRPQLIRKENPMITYAGSLLGYSANEAGQTKSVSLITLKSKDEAPVIERIPYEPKRKIRKVEGYFEDLMLLPPTEDLCVVTLLDERPPLDYVPSLRTVFRSLLEVRIKDLYGALRIQTVDGDKTDVEDMDDLSLFEEFYAFSTGRELPEDGKTLLKELLDQEGGTT